VVPLQVLMTGWGDVDAGYKGYVHSVSYFEDSEHTRLIERWRYIGVGLLPGRAAWSVTSARSAPARTGASTRRCLSTRAARTSSLSSELVTLNQNEDAILPWEEAEVRRCMGLVIKG
jgi:hypothetical protein